ncbi:SpoIIE family protein phosphatase [Peptoniphilus catoniae]|uniref:SpoIIE family protein phosphatase n=1 Tax=Peptoniphilus catoniae TaxID=1660341 RepID=UPI0010FE92D0|nr:SpoIIE family protein phosphatase [Peptoniphilus catoniae]
MKSVYKDIIFNKSKLNYQMLDAIADLVRVIDANDRVIFVNSAMEKQLGYDKMTLVCRIDEFEIPTTIAKRTIDTGEIIQREEIINGIYYSVKCSPIRNTGGQILGAIEVFRNISTERKLITEIIDKNKNLSVEMAQAEKIQTLLLPEEGFNENIKLNYIYKPSSILSGDMFDLFKIDEDNFGIYIADTVGHGFAASMLTMFIRFIIRSIRPYTLLSPAKALKALQTRFSELNLGIENYFTFFYGVYNKKTSAFLYSNAGHYPSPILISKGEAQVLESRGYPITKFLKDADYTEKKTDLNTGDKLFLMTDGIMDSKNSKNEIYGTNRVVKILEDHENGELDLLANDLYKFTLGEQKDDITAVLLKVW